jgi:hypothetical protein
MLEGVAFIVNPADPDGTVTLTALVPDVVIVTNAGTSIGNTSPVAVLGPSAPPTTWIVVGTDAVPMSCSARVIVLSAHDSPPEPDTFPVPFASLPLVGSTT